MTSKCHNVSNLHSGTLFVLVAVYLFIYFENNIIIIFIGG